MDIVCHYIVAARDSSHYQETPMYQTLIRYRAIVFMTLSNCMKKKSKNLEGVRRVVGKKCVLPFVTSAML